MATPRDIVFSAHPGRRGTAWLAGAWALFSRARLPWLYLLAVYYLAMIGISLVPVVGQLAVPLLKPVFAVGFLAAAWMQERGARPRVPDLFNGFRSNLLALITIGAVFVLGITAAVMSTMLVDGGKFIDALTTSPPAQQSEREAWAASIQATFRDPSTLMAMLFAVLVALPTIAAVWFAPGLVVFQDVSASSALAHSFRAALANWRPLAVYALSVFFIAGVVPGTLLALVALLLPPSLVDVLRVLVFLPYMFFVAATLHVSDYVSYRDVFHSGETLAPLTPGAGRPTL